MKRSSDSSHSESETKRLHTDHSTRDVVMVLDDPDVSRAAAQPLMNALAKNWSTHLQQGDLMVLTLT